MLGEHYFFLFRYYDLYYTYTILLHDGIPYYHIFQLIILFCTNLSSNYLITITMTIIILIMITNIIFSFLRNKVEWSADVRAVLRGFDTANSGKPSYLMLYELRLFFVLCYFALCHVMLHLIQSYATLV
jgi:hypothetical protein